MLSLLVAALPPLVLDWPKFIAALVLLLPPSPLFFGRNVGYDSLARILDQFLPGVFRLAWHWVDLCRALVGVWFLTLTLGIGHAPRQTPPYQALVVLAAVLSVALVLQTVVCKEPNSFHAAFAFVVATIVVLFPPLVAGFALVCGVMSSTGFRSAMAFFGMTAVCLVIFGYWFYPNWLLLAVGALMSGLPLLLPMLFGRELVLAHCPAAAEVESS